MRLVDILLETHNKPIVDDFANFVAKELQLKSFPKVHIVSSINFPQEKLTFGSFNKETNEIYVYSGKRHIVDVLRTLAHELVHHKQKENGATLDGTDGSETENEANAKAGELMRKYRKLRPRIYEGA